MHNRQKRAAHGKGVSYASTSAPFPNLLILTQQAFGGTGTTPTQQPYSPTPPPQPVPSQPSPQDMPPPPKMNSAARAVMSIMAVILIAGLVYYTYVGVLHKTITPPPPANITNASHTSRFDVSACTSITSPGTYRLTRNILTASTNGPCISVKSSNVILEGDGNRIVGSGPFVQIPPFSYGIKASGVNNVTVLGVNVSRFSYGIYISGSQGAMVSNALVLNATMSGIYLNGTEGAVVSGSRVYGAGSQEGGVGVVGGGNNRIINNIIMDNAYYGLSINSTSNEFINDTIVSNPIDLYCGSSANLRRSNLFSGSNCAANYHCNFAQCSNTNQPYPIESIVLTGSRINSCGSITVPGAYSVGTGLNLSDYINTSGSASGGACIRIASPNVRLDCANNTVSNAYYGIYSTGNYNVTITNCRLYNDTYGIYLGGSFSDNVSGVTASKSTYALYLSNETSVSVSHLDLLGNTYGIYLNGSSAVTVSNSTSSGNSYGLYYSTGSTNSFLGSTFSNNTATDFFCSASTYNSSFDIFRGNTCGTTDCNWGACSTHVLAPLPFYPVSSCGALSIPGNYSLQSDLLQGSGASCISLDSSNIRLNCNGHMIEGKGTGSAIRVAGRNNISIDNCVMGGYAFGINATDTSFLTVGNSTASNVSVGYSLIGSNFSRISRSSATTFSRYGVLASRVNNSIISNNTASKGVYNATGFMFYGSNRNVVVGNNADSNPQYGFSFSDSRDNSVSNNTALSNYKYDYGCFGTSMGIYSNPSLVNTGINKNGCFWMVERSQSSAPLCYAISKSSYISLQQDMLYSYGQTCYTIFDTNSSSAQGSVVNCNGHTILASHGGTFATVGSQGAVIENCYLRNFTRAIVVTGRHATLINDTIIGSNYSVVLSNATYPSIMDSNFSNDTYGIYSQESRYGTVQDNAFVNVRDGIYMIGGSAFKMLYNSMNAVSTGITLLDSQLNELQNNMLLNATANGIACTKFASNSTSNIDSGGNICSSNSNCLWMTSSTGCSPS